MDKFSKIDKVKESINQIRPSLQNDGGDIDFVRMEGDTVYVRLKGACAGCMMATLTLKDGVERMLKMCVDENIIVENLPFED